MFCTINISKFKDQISKFEYRNDSLQKEVPDSGPIQIMIGDKKVNVKVVTFVFNESGSFVGGNGNWEELKNFFSNKK